MILQGPVQKIQSQFRSNRIKMKFFPEGALSQKENDLIWAYVYGDTVHINNTTVGQSFRKLECLSTSRVIMGLAFLHIVFKDFHRTEVHKCLCNT